MLKENQRKTLKNLLFEKKEQLLSEATLGQNIIEELRREDSSDELDYAEISSDSHNLSILRDKQLQDLKEIEFALTKIESNTYGICEMCDEDIEIKRLKIKPHARFCVECREVYERSLHR